MANPTRIQIEQRAFQIALAPDVVANLSAIRYADNGLDVYGLPAGTSLYDIRVGDVITDPTIIATIIGVTPAAIDTPAFPNPSPPLWSAF